MNKYAIAILAFGVVSLPSLANAVPVPADLSAWVAQGTGTWNLQSTNSPNDSVLQTVNGNPTAFISPVNAQGTGISGKIKVTTTGDDDYIGFVLGFQPNDFGNAAANYLLLDWKQGNQPAFGCTAQRGLAISRVTGVLADGRGAWCHDPAFNVTELARGNNLSDTGWADNTEYTFDIIFNPGNVIVEVDGVEEINISGSFANGRVGFYNYSQASVLYSAIEERQTCGGPNLPPCNIPVPEASSIGMLSLGLFGLGLGVFRRRMFS